MRNVISTLILSLLLPTACFPQQRVISRIISVLRHPYYGPNVLPAVKELVGERGKSKRNHFYVGTLEVLEGGYDYVLVYWKENRVLILWEPGRGLDRRGLPDPRYDLWHSRRYWDLDKDVVPTLAMLAEVAS